jgi:hypothetical protein
LEITVDYVVGPDRTHIPLRGNQTGNGGKKNEIVGMVCLTLFVSILGVFINGRDANLHRGLVHTMYVVKDTELTPYMALVNANKAAPTLPSAQTLYTMNDGTQVVGVQSAFDGSTYAVTTATGTRLIKVSDVKGVYQITAPAVAAGPTTTLQN